MRKKGKHFARKMRHARVRKKVRGDKERPRLVVYKSSRHIYAQVIDDENGSTLVSASTLSSKLSEKPQNGGNVAAAKMIGGLIGKEALSKGINKVIFDRGGYLYNGRVKMLADSAREAGLEF